MEITDFMDEEQLNELYLSTKITDLQYVKHHSPSMLDAYNNFIAVNVLPDGEEAAARFLAEECTVAETELEAEETTGEENVESETVAVYTQWGKDMTLIQEMLDNIVLVAKVALWRYNNPTSQDLQICADATDLSKEKVEKWWRSIDFVCGSLGGSSFNMATPSLDNMKSVLENAAYSILED